MKNRIVISFSLFEHAYQYIVGLVENCQDINRLYPTFWIYIYLGNDFNRSIMDGKFTSFKNIKFIDTNISGSLNMCYRFFPIDDEDVDIAFSRDADSRINERDQYCINQFLKSDKKFQIIRDDINHKRLIMGGMWGIKKGCINFSIREYFYRYFFDKSRNRNYECDQDFLSDIFYPEVKDSAIIFDNYKHFPDEITVTIIGPTGPDDGVGARIETSNPQPLPFKVALSPRVEKYVPKFSILHTIKFR